MGAPFTTAVAVVGFILVSAQLTSGAFQHIAKLRKLSEVTVERAGSRGYLVGALLSLTLIVVDLTV